VPIIAFCGIDGSGKSTQVDMLEEWFRARELPVDVARPISPDSAFLRTVEELERRCEALESRFPLQSLGHIMAFEALRNMNGRIRERSEEGGFVICDRYMLTHPVYAAAYRVDASGIDALLENAPRPALTFLLDVPVQDALRRIRARAKDGGRNEAPAVLERARSAYLQRAAESAAIVLNGLAPAAATHASIVEITARRFALGEWAPAPRRSEWGRGAQGEDAC